VYFLVYRSYINQIYGSRSKIPSKKSRPYIYIYDVKFLAFLGAPCIYDISRLRLNSRITTHITNVQLYTAHLALFANVQIWNEDIFRLTDVKLFSCMSHKNGQRIFLFRTTMYDELRSRSFSRPVFSEDVPDCAVTN
jgi:hypothetical protein